MSQFQDIKITCVCGEEFVWTKGEQDFLQGLVNDGKTNRDNTPVTFTQPKRCKECRAAKKAMRERNGF